MSRERPPSGDASLSAPESPPISRRSFLFGSIATVALVACGPGEDPEPSATTVEPTDPSTPTDVATRGKWYEAPPDSGYGEPPLDLVSAPGSPAFPGGQVRLTSASGMFGKDGTVVLHASDSDPSEGKQLPVSEPWEPDHLVVTLPDSEPQGGGASPSPTPSGKGPLAPFRLTVQPGDGSPAVHVDIYVWGFGPTPEFDALPDEEV